MKKIINNKKYDTDTANAICVQEVFYYSSEEKARYLRSIDTLYQKDNGEYFIYHKSLRKVLWDMVDKIRTITDESAIAFCQKNMAVDDYEKRFGPVEE